MMVAIKLEKNPIMPNKILLLLARTMNRTIEKAKMDSNNLKTPLSFPL
jgi:hypothetical protein